MKALEDSNGNKSSKRITGVSMLAGGSGMAVTLFVFSLFKTVADSATAITVMKSILIAGGGLLGIGIAEFFKKK